MVVVEVIMVTDRLRDGYDVVVVGGGAAGLSGAPVDGRPARTRRLLVATGNADLVAEETRQAVAAHRHPFSPESEARVCELVMGDHRHGL
jgi:hypothetical protein